MNASPQERQLAAWPLPASSWLVLVLFVFCTSCGRKTRTTEYFSFPPSMAVRDTDASGAAVLGNALTLPPGTSAAFVTLLLPATTLHVAAGQMSPPIRVSVELDDKDPISTVLTGTASWTLPDDCQGFAKIGFTNLQAGGAFVEHTVRLTAALTAPRTTVRQRRTRTESVKNAILYVVDTARWDYFGMSHAWHDTSPHFDELAETAAVFSHARAQAPWTRASVASLLTGLQPWRHRANAGAETLAADLDTLAEILSRRGLTTAAFTTNANVAPSLGFSQGFDHFDYLREHGEKVHVPAEQLHARALAWLDALDPERDFFLWIHATDPHAPYTPDTPHASELDRATEEKLRSIEFLMRIYESREALPLPQLELLLDLYAEEVRYWDAQLGLLVEALSLRGLLEETLLIVVADHGEEFYEHRRWQHSTSVFEEAIRIPLLIRLPGSTRRDGQVLDQPVQQVDVFATLLDALDIPVDSSVAGRSLLPFLYGEQPDPLSHQVSSLETRDRPLVDSIVLFDHKLIRRWRSPRDHRLALYDLRNDPGEHTNLILSKPIAKEALLRLLEAATSARQPDAVGADAQQLDPELAATLRALGYLP